MKADDTLKFSGLALLVLLSISTMSPFSGAAATEPVKPNVRTVAIQLQTVYDWGIFRSELQKLKSIGVDAIESLVGWENYGAYYKEFADILKEYDFRWIPLLSVHGISIPSWVWQYYPDAKFVDEFNETSQEYLSYWHPQTRPLIENVYRNFFAAFKDYNETIYGVYVSAGMWSELMYPWLPRQAYWGYDVNARADFRQKMSGKYDTIENANQQWGTSFSNWTGVNPPLPDTAYTNMWNDFLWWYNSTLVSYEDWILNMTQTYYNGPVYIKIPMSDQPQLGLLDFDAVFSTAAKYKAIPTYTCVEDNVTAITYANKAAAHNSTYWGENAGEDADFNRVLSSLKNGGYEVYCHYRIDTGPPANLGLFDTQGNTTARFQDFKDFIKQWDPAPVVEFEYQPNEPSTGIQITFNASESQDINGVITSYEWNFDDGNTTTVTTPIITHAYDERGDYTVTLNITNDGGLWNMASKHLLVYEHDVAVEAITVYTTILDYDPVNLIYVTAANRGDFSESFNVTLYANATLIQTQTTSLLKGASTKVTFNWNTTGFQLENYTLSAHAWPVPGETNTSNNNFTGGLVTVSLVGDITGPDGWRDGKVDIRDVSLVARHFGETVPPAPANCDLTGPTQDVPDGKIDIRDVSLVARHFGGHCP